MDFFKELPWLALKRIFKYADIDSCVHLHEIINIPEEEWRKKIIKLYKNEPEIVICDVNVTKDEMLACIYAGIDINGKTVFGTTALHFASYYGYKEAVDLLIDRGADINAKDYHGWTALHKASSLGYKDIVELLIEKGININTRNVLGSTALHIASYHNGYKDIVELLIDRESEINAKNNDGNTALHNASIKKNKKIVKLLKKHGAIK